MHCVRFGCVLGVGPAWSVVADRTFVDATRPEKARLSQKHINYFLSSSQRFHRLEMKFSVACAAVLVSSTASAFLAPTFAPRSSRSIIVSPAQSLKQSGVVAASIRPATLQ